MIFSFDSSPTQPIANAKAVSVPYQSPTWGSIDMNGYDPIIYPTNITSINQGVSYGDFFGFPKQVNKVTIIPHGTVDISSSTAWLYMFNPATAPKTPPQYLIQRIALEGYDNTTGIYVPEGVKSFGYIPVRFLVIENIVYNTLGDYITVDVDIL